jgi:formylglycine-generating enzyme required for sulfatase activity
MDLITGYILNHFLGLAANLHSDYIITAQKDRQAAQFLEADQARKALEAWRSIADDVRIACLELADHHEQLWVSPAQQQLRPLLRDSSFHQDFVEWLQVGAIEEGEPVKARMIQKMEALLSGAEISEEQRQFLHSHFFSALDKAVFADDVLSRWRFELSLRFLREQVAEGRRLAEEAAGKYAPERQLAALEAYCRHALLSWDIIDLASLPNDPDIATQKLLLRQLYMPLRISFEAQQPDRDDQGMLVNLEQQREASRLRDAGRRDAREAHAIHALSVPVAIGERLGTGQRFVVLGDPGGGKTTMLRWLATAYLLRHTNDLTARGLPDAETLPDQSWIPVLIRCREIGDDDLCRSFKEVLGMHLKKSELQDQDAEVMLAVILDRLAKGEVLLLVDGLDEISDRRVRQAFCKQLECTAERYPEAPIMVTSRIVGYRDMPERLRKGFAHGVIADLQPEIKDLFVKRWVEVTEAHQTKSDRNRSAEDLMAALHSSDRIERLTNNPMLLTTMALVKRKVGKLPTRRNKLYAEAVAVLLNWNPNVYTVIEEEEALPQLAFLAYEMCRRGVQSLTGEEVLDLLDQLRNDYPKLRALRRRDSEQFLQLLEERSGLLMRAGVQWQPNHTQAKAIWEFRHLTFQEYLAAVALNHGHYKGRDSSQSLAMQVAPLATPAPLDASTRDPSQKDVDAGSDSWREALRLLVAICKDDDVDDVLMSILDPGPGEEAAITQRPRAILAAQCLAEEPNVDQATAREVLQRFVALIGEKDGLAAIDSNLEKLALAVWQSHPDHRDALQACLLEAFAEPDAAMGRHCGAVLAQLFGATNPGTTVAVDERLEMIRSSLRAPDDAEAIGAALQVLDLAYQGSLAEAGAGTEALAQDLLSLLGRGGPPAHGAAWALAWLSVDALTDQAKRGSYSNNRLHPPVLATVWEGSAGGGGWLPTDEQSGLLLGALERAEASAGDGNRYLIPLIAKTAQTRFVLPLLDCLADADAAVRKAACAALAWLANHLLSPLHADQLAALEEQVGAHLVRNESLANAERCEALMVLALFGLDRLLQELLADQGAPVALRRQAAEGLGLVASRCSNGDQRMRLRQELEGWLRADALDLLVEGEAGWAEHDRQLPPLQGASRGLQLAASADLPLLGSGPGRAVPMLTLTALQQGEALRIRTEVVTPPVWRLPLPGGEQLELVVVPGGEYKIGSPEEEAGRDVYTQFRQECEGVNVEAERKVTLKPYALVHHPLSQAQWRAVAGLPRLERDLSLTPGTYKPFGLWETHAQPGGLAVDSVSWHDCQEWLQRLNLWLKEQWPVLGGEGEAPVFGLPSESQWEAACRAGASTPFHFGDTLDVSWANYNGNYTFGGGRSGGYRQRPVVVGAFGLVNRWGLAELHGQVYEWCADQWQRDPLLGALGDGSPAEGPDPELEGNQEQSYRLLRGGSWFNDPLFCRAAYRNGVIPDFGYALDGLRPCCPSPPGLFLGP